MAGRQEGEGRLGRVLRLQAPGQDRAGQAGKNLQDSD